MTPEQYRSLVTRLESIQNGAVAHKHAVINPGSGHSTFQTQWVNEGELGRKIGGIFGQKGAELGDKIGDLLGGPDKKPGTQGPAPSGKTQGSDYDLGSDAAEPTARTSSFTPATPSQDADFGPEWREMGGGVKGRRDPSTGEWEVRDQYGNTTKDYKTMPDLDPVVGSLGLNEVKPSQILVQLIKTRGAQFYPTQSWDCYGGNIALCQIDHSEGMGYSKGAYIDYSTVARDSSAMKGIFAEMGWKLVGSQPDSARTGLGNAMTNEWTLKSKSGLVIVSEFMGNVAFQKGADKGLSLYVGMFVGSEDVYDKYGEKALSALASSLKLSKGAVPLKPDQ